MLDAYFNAASGSERESALEQIRRFVQPVLTRSIRAKLNVSMSNGDRSHLNQDALDLAADTELLFFSRLETLRQNGESDHIENLEGYVRQVAQNAFNRYLRSRYPVRSRLRNQIRYILLHDPKLRIEPSDEGVFVCRTMDVDSTVSNDQTQPISLDPLRSRAFELSLPALVVSALELADRPLPLEHLVSIVFELKGLSEQHQVDEETAFNITGTAENQASSMEQHELLQKIWEELGQMPIMHRRALLLNLTDRRGESLIQELPMVRVASIRSIADILEIPHEAFADLWNQLPLDDNRIAELFGLTRQQVINLRHSARSRLKRSLGDRSATKRNK